MSFGIELGSRFWYVMLCGLDMVAYAGAGYGDFGQGSGF